MTNTLIFEKLFVFGPEQKLRCKVMYIVTGLDKDLSWYQNLIPFVLSPTVINLIVHEMDW